MVESCQLFVCWVIFHAFVVDCRCFFKITISENSFKKTIRVSNSLDPDQSPNFVGPDLVPKMQKLSADNISR